MILRSAEDAEVLCMNMNMKLRLDVSLSSVFWHYKLVLLKAFPCSVCLAAAIIIKPGIFSNEACFSKTYQQSWQASRSSAAKSTQCSSGMPILLNTHTHKDASCSSCPRRGTVRGPLSSGLAAPQTLSSAEDTKFKPPFW